MTADGPNGPRWPPEFLVTMVAETGSTNADLIAVAASSPGGTVLIADHQTAGRGRLDRTWESTDASRVGGPNLLMSILFKPVGESPHSLTRRVVIAAARACERVAGVTPELKWPNDLLLGGAKLAGILAEAGAVDGRLDHVVVGIGLNVAWAPSGAARLPIGHRDAVAAAILDELATMPEDLTDEYRRRLGTLGAAVRVEMPAESFEGIAVDVDVDGQLIVDVSGQLRRVGVGDIIHLRPAGDAARPA